MFVKVLLPFAFILCSFQLAAQPKPVIRIALAEDFYPFYGTNADGAPVGASFEIAQSVLARLGYDVRVTKYTDMKASLNALDSGSQDLMVNLSETPERAKFALFTSTPHIYETQDLIARADSPIGFDGLLINIAQFNIGIVYGWTYGPDFDSSNFLTKTPVLDSVTQLKGLLSGRFDLAINNRQYFMSRAETLGVDTAFMVLQPSVYELPVTLAVSRKYPDATGFRDSLENEVSRFIHTEEYRSILAKYGFDTIAPEVM
ncbi:substrate-binding periplasmic protein [Pontibacter sp. JAM-7]